MSHRVHLAATSIDVAANDGAPLPTEIRLFMWGENHTTKGTFILDATSAAAIMADYEAHGVDVMFDLEHLSLDTESVNFDPDARAWAKLALRGSPGDPNGGLFATQINWTADGERRLRNKTQRYVSPAFWADDDGRITEILNIALVAMPATHKTPALVAASTRRKNSMSFDLSNATRVAAGMKAQCVALSSRAIKLAEEAPIEGEAPAPQKGKVAAILDQMKAAQAEIAEVEKALKGKDIDAIFGAMASAAEVMKGFYESLEAFNGAKQTPAEPPAEPPAVASEASEEPAKEEPEQMSRSEKDELIRLRAESKARDEKAREDKLAAEAKERIELIGELVNLSALRPSLAWEGGVRGVPAALYRNADVETLRAQVNQVKQTSHITAGNIGPQHPVASADSDVEVSEWEANRVKVYAAKRKRDLEQTGLAHLARTEDEVLARYVDHKSQQAAFAKESEPHRLAQLSRGVKQEHVLLDIRGERLVSLASVAPIETFGTSSQRALEEFRLEYNMALAAEPQTWAEQIGNMLPGGALKTTFPLNFDAVMYAEKTHENSPAAVAQTKDVEVTKKEFFAGKQVNLRRLQMGDFAYVQNWSQQAQQLARARVYLRNRLVAALIEANGNWVDGTTFFSATHAVNPFDANIKLRGSATWSNVQASANPLAAGTLTAEKATSIQVAQANGEELGYEYDALLVPSILAETAKNLLTVQDVILDAGTVNGVANAFGGVRNPHFNSGVTYIKGVNLTGTASTADWYLVSRSAIAAGLTPWVISEDATDEIRFWDESSDFYKNSGDIKITSHVYTNVAFMWPHAIKLVKGT